MVNSIFFRIFATEKTTTLNKKIMTSRIKMQVVVTFTADVDSDLTLSDIMERTDISAVGDGEFVEVYDTEVETFNLLDSK